MKTKNLFCLALALWFPSLLIGKGIPDARAQTGTENVTPYDYGAVGDGVADDTNAIQAALGTRKLVSLPHGTFRTTKTLSVPGGGGLSGPATIVPDFDLLPPDQPSTYASAIVVSGDNALLEGFKIKKEFADGSYANGIVGDHVRNLIVRDVEISGYSARYGIHLVECENFEISGCYIHDFLMDAAADMIADSPAGIRITRSHKGIVSGNRVFNIEVGPNGLESISPLRPSYGPQGYQSDHMTITQCSGVTIEGNICRTSGEGIDMLLSTSCVLSKNIITNIWFQGFKMLGVSYCTVNGNFFSDCYQGVGLAYHPVVEQEASGNAVNANIMRDMGSPGSFGIPGTSRVSFGGAHGIDIHDRDLTRYNTVTDNIVADTQTFKTTESAVRNGGGETNVLQHNLFSVDLTLE
ncbi:MAG: right-handed parallel beta-helix repeat-containing protein [Candidatus Omnitrophica bacterium]|nr:right-handed parallel beta-helix repeat-containing protein [Candidatus Omnitrophota bacterium]